MIFHESPYLRWVKNKDPRPHPQYIYELDCLRAMVRQGDIGWGGTWTKERYQRLKEKHPEALMAFEAEIRWEKEEEQHRKEILDKYKHSPYTEVVEGWPDSEAKENYLKDLRQLRDVMVKSQKLGYGGYAMNIIYKKLRDKYPFAYEVFAEELEER